MKINLKDKKKDMIFTFCLLIAVIILIFIPTGFQRQIYFNAEGCKALVLETDDSTMVQNGLFRQGEQRVKIRLLSGSHKYEEVWGINMLQGELKQDKVFKKFDKAWVLMEKDINENIVFVNMIDHYRLDKEVILLGIVCIFLIIFAGSKGIRTILSFIFALLMLWKVMIPLSLKGYDPLFIAILTFLLISVSTLFLVAGLNQVGLSSLLGTILSAIVTFTLSALLTAWLGIHGSVLEMSEAILYAGYQNLNLTRLFSGVIVLSAGGAIMDLSIDVAVCMNEVKVHSPNVSKKELFLSGMEMGRNGVGTQITTLLLAYMSSFLTILMVYMAQSTPLLNILTSKSIASEILQSAIGMLSLILVSPLTSLVGSFLMSIHSKFN